MKKWYQYWTVWAAIASLLACWVIGWIGGEQAQAGALGGIAKALAIVALVFFIAFFVRRGRGKKAAAAAQTQQAAQAAAQTQQTVSSAAQPQRTEAAGTQAPAGPRATFERHKVAGTTYHLDAIMELAEDNPDYDMTQREIIDAGMEEQRIYQYTFPGSPVELVDDPDNEQDPNAIKVLVAGQHIGYIKRGSTGRIHKLQRSGRVLGVTAEIYGGRYKIVRCVEEYQMQHYEMDRDESLYGAAIELRIQPEPEPVSTLDT